ncbi:MAG TPA: hypothetical protein DDY93_13730, partial [Dehalococcoidia bacterium]|nr:hypothetical protein [Dehalococcoidia bacterium]
GGRTCHAAIVSREMGLPCIVDTIDGTTPSCETSRWQRWMAGPERCMRATIRRNSFHR